MNPMERDPNSRWVERNSSGRLFYVRKRTKRPPTRSFLNDLFGKSNNPFGRSRSQSETRTHLTQQAPVRTSTSLTAATPVSTRTPHITTKMNNTPDSGRAIIHDTGQYSQAPFDPNQHFSYPQYPSFPVQYPGYYLAPNPPAHSFPDVYPHLPPGARILSPPRPPTADELKYKCSICGKFRSPRFHYKHPIPPGELPCQTVCRKCRQTGTDSDDTSVEKVRVRGARRSRSVMSVSEPIRTRIISEGDGGILRRQPSRVRIVSRSRSRHRGRGRRRSISSSSSVDLDELEIVDEIRPRRFRSRSVGTVVERVRYVEQTRPLRVSPPRETIYIDESPPLRRRRASRVDNDYETDLSEEEDFGPVRRIISRARSVTRSARRQLSDPLVREHVGHRARVYSDEQNFVSEIPSLVERALPSRSRAPRELHILRVSEDEAHRIRERVASSDEYELVADQPIPKQSHHEHDWYEEEAKRSRRDDRHQRRRRSRVDLVEDVERGKSRHEPNKLDRVSQHQNSQSLVYNDAPRILPNMPAPSPPSADRRRSARHSFASRPPESIDDGRRTRRHEAIDRDRRPVGVGTRTRSRSRSKSRAQSQSEPRWNAPFGGRPPLAGSESVQLQERIEGITPATEDYDWYDSHGQRVRVREI